MHIWENMLSPCALMLEFKALHYMFICFLCYLWVLSVLLHEPANLNKLLDHWVGLASVCIKHIILIVYEIMPSSKKQRMFIKVSLCQWHICIFFHINSGAFLTNNLGEVMLKILIQKEGFLSGIRLLSRKWKTNSLLLVLVLAR